jgi:hypothetical protein
MPCSTSPSSPSGGCASAWWLRLGLVAAPRLVGLREVDEGILLVTFMHDDLGHIDLEQKTFQPIHNPSGTRLSPMFQERGVTCVSGPDKKEMVPRGGFEPPTLQFSVACSTN